jgi:hypothetical protein
MMAMRKGGRTRKLPTFDSNENALSDRDNGQRVLVVGMLIFCLAFCALVFQAGFKEVWAYGKCNLDGVSNCQTMASSPLDTQ